MSALPPAATAYARALRRRVVRFAQVDAEERRAALTALALLPGVALALRTGGMAPARALAAHLAAALPELSRDLPARRVAELLESAAGSLGRPGPLRVTCLARSIALCALLERRGERPALQLGVRKGESERELDAHAWVELGGEVLNDDAGSLDQRYTRLASL